MFPKVLEGSRYAVRVVGLAIVIGVAAFLLFAAVASKKPNAIGALAAVLSIAAAVLSWPRLPNAWKADPPTERQLAYAEKLGLVLHEGITKGQLSDMISKATGR
jgi:membrane protein implicated in regulation of membrane protease activity